MNINIQVNDMKEAERLSIACRKFPYELTLRAGNRLAADPKSLLGVLAMMYEDRRALTLNTGDLPDEYLSDFTQAISPFLPKAAA